MSTEVSATTRAAADKSLGHVTYALYAASLMIGLTALIAIIINYVKREDVRGTLLESHFRWQMRTFWFGMLWGLIGGCTVLLVVGWPILIANWIWWVYRVVKGWLHLNDGKPMYV